MVFENFFGDAVHFAAEYEADAVIEAGEIGKTFERDRLFSEFDCNDEKLVFT